MSPGCYGIVTNPRELFESGSRQLHVWLSRHSPEGPETGTPITEAGVLLLPADARNEFGPALVRVLTDDAYRESLAERSRRAQERYFSWSAIAEQYVKFLMKSGTAINHPAFGPYLF